MIRETEIRVAPALLHDEPTLRRMAAKKLGLGEADIRQLKTLRRSVDARARQPVFQIRVAVATGNDRLSAPDAILSRFTNVADRPEVAIIGAGPAGYFAALEIIESGLRPIIFDRGKDVRARRRDLRAIQQFGQVNEDSNYCFGEGGAGTYSDGKLYTRSHKRGKIEKAMRLLVEHGANPDILVDAHPHIGSNKLPKIVAGIRETIERFGGQVHFNSRVVDIVIEQQRIRGLRVQNGQEFQCEHLILATGHSARDIYYLLHERGLKMEAKPFALGVRIEHAQRLIDQIQYNQSPREEALPAASYKLVSQVEGRGVFSFCMCPGGLVVPAATAPGELVVNGMSMSRRDSAYANSGTVVAVEVEDMMARYGADIFAGLRLQQQVERAMYEVGDGSQRAPAQRLIDFVDGRLSKDLPSTSYIPGLFSAPLHRILPDFVYRRLRQGIRDFGKKMKGYYTNEAVVIGTESRTSSPLRIPRNSTTFMHEQIEGLFPCGEGAGFAGGIISAAMDGQNVARAVAQRIGSSTKSTA